MVTIAAIDEKINMYGRNMCLSIILDANFEIKKPISVPGNRIIDNTNSYNPNLPDKCRANNEIKVPTIKKPLIVPRNLSAD